MKLIAVFQYSLRKLAKLTDQVMKCLISKADRSSNEMFLHDLRRKLSTWVIILFQTLFTYYIPLSIKFANRWARIFSRLQITLITEYPILISFGIISNFPPILCEEKMSFLQGLLTGPLDCSLWGSLVAISVIHHYFSDNFISLSWL